METLTAYFLYFTHEEVFCIAVYMPLWLNGIHHLGFNWL